MSNISEVNDQSFEKEVLKSRLPVLVDFWAEWCGPCKMLTPVLEKTAESFQGRLSIFKMNVDENPVAPANYQVLSIPCLIIFNAGKEVGRLIGFMDEKKLRAGIEEIIKKL